MATYFIPMETRGFDCVPMPIHRFSGPISVLWRLTRVHSRALLRLRQDTFCETITIHHIERFITDKHVTSIGDLNASVILNKCL